MYRSSVPYYSRSAGYSTAGTRRSADDYTRGTEPLSSSVYSSLNSSRYASQPISTTLSSTCPSASSSASGVISSVARVPETSSAQAGGASSRAYLLRSGREYDYSEPKNESTGPAAAFSNVTPYSRSYTAQPSPATDNTTRPSNNTTTSTTTRTSTSYQSPRTSSYTLSGRPFEYTRSTEPSRASSYSSRTFPSSERYSSVAFRTVASSPGSVQRSEAERARYRMLGCDEVGGRRNVASDKDFMDKNKALKKSDQQNSVDQLIPKEISLHEKDNRRSHHTDKYEHSNLIVRRGQSFDVTVTFNRAYDARRDVITLQFAVGYRPQQSKGSVIRVPISLTKERVYKAWSANLAQVNKESVRLQVTSAVDAVVGKYQLYVETKTAIRGSDKPEEYRYQHPEDIIVLFNPWCREDSVYLDQEALRDEYVLNESGRIWIGTARKHCGMPWNFGQFEDVSLNSCLWLMDKAQLATAARANPLRVSRSISAMANFNDQDGGVLHGRWDGNYPRDTTAPSSWSGSVAILEQFWQKKCDIKYGQCWVFSGLVTTLLRALGIPTRSVTNFASAHDSDASMTIDFHFDEDGKPLKELDDSVWNFHVWNESWFKRPDLPDGHDGWQAHDATPQETSYGVFRCGPASVKAVKQGEVYLPYDTSFVFAEVNGDRVFWEVEEGGPMKPIRVDKKCIGKLISTKAVGSDDREDITHDYKHPEGSIAERRAVELAYKFSSRKDQAIYGLPAEDIKFTFDLPEDVPIGKDVSVALKMKNTTYQSRTVKGKMTAVIGFYTGIPCKDLKEEEFDMILEPRKEKAFILEIPSALYLDKCEADGGLKIYVKATVKENGQRFASYDIIEFRKPDMEIEVTRGKPRIGNDIEVKLSFENPLPLNITGGKWYIETSGANPKSKIIPNSATVSEGREVQTSFKITPYRAGLCQVCATFRSDVISGVRGYGSLKISE